MVDLGGELLQVRTSCTIEAAGCDVPEAEVEDLWAQVVTIVCLNDVSKTFERLQDAVHRGASQIELGGQVAHGANWFEFIECANDVEATRECLDELLVVAPVRHLSPTY